MVRIGDGDERGYLGVRDADALGPQRITELDGVDCAWQSDSERNKRRGNG